MRTYIVGTGLLAALILISAPAAALSPDLESFLQQIGVLPPPPQPDPLPVGDPVDAEDAARKSNTLLGDLAAALGVAAVPAVILSKTLSLLGLSLAAGLFGGVEEGGRLAATAATTVANYPASSFFIASISIALVGAASALGGLIQRYGAFASIPLYTRIAKSELLENGVRQQIFDLIQQNPGINVSEISRRLDIAWGTATHHLQKLRHELLVSIRMTNNQKCYFPNGGTYTPREMDVMSAVKHPTARHIAEYLIQGGPHCHRDIVQALGLTPALVSFHTGKLVDRGVLGRERQGRQTIFTALESTLEPVPRAASH